MRKLFLSVLITITCILAFSCELFTYAGLQGPEEEIPDIEEIRDLSVTLEMNENLDVEGLHYELFELDKNGVKGTEPYRKENLTSKAFTIKELPANKMFTIEVKGTAKDTKVPGVTYTAGTGLQNLKIHQFADNKLKLTLIPTTGALRFLMPDQDPAGSTQTNPLTITIFDDTPNKNSENLKEPQKITLNEGGTVVQGIGSSKYYRAEVISSVAEENTTYFYYCNVMPIAGKCVDAKVIRINARDKVKVTIGGSFPVDKFSTLEYKVFEPDIIAPDSKQPFDRFLKKGDIVSLDGSRDFLPDCGFENGKNYVVNIYIKETGKLLGSHRIDNFGEKIEGSSEIKNQFTIYLKETVYVGNVTTATPDHSQIYSHLTTAYKKIAEDYDKGLGNDIFYEIKILDENFSIEENTTVNVDKAINLTITTDETLMSQAGLKTSVPNVTVLKVNEPTAVVRLNGFSCDLSGHTEAGEGFFRVEKGSLELENCSFDKSGLEKCTSVYLATGSKGLILRTSNAFTDLCPIYMANGTGITAYDSVDDNYVFNAGPLYIYLPEDYDVTKPIITSKQSDPAGGSDSPLTFDTVANIESNRFLDKDESTDTIKVSKKTVQIKYNLNGAVKKLNTDAEGNEINTPFDNAHNVFVCNITDNTGALVHSTGSIKSHMGLFEKELGEKVGFTIGQPYTFTVYDGLMNRYKEPITLLAEKINAKDGYYYLDINLYDHCYIEAKGEAEDTGRDDHDGLTFQTPVETLQTALERIKSSTVSPDSTATIVFNGKTANEELASPVEINRNLRIIGQNKAYSTVYNYYNRQFDLENPGNKEFTLTDNSQHFMVIPTGKKVTVERLENEYTPHKIIFNKGFNVNGTLELGQGAIICSNKNFTPKDYAQYPKLPNSDMIQNADCLHGDALTTIGASGTLILKGIQSTNETFKNSPLAGNVKIEVGGKINIIGDLDPEHNMNFAPLEGYSDAAKADPLKYSATIVNANELVGETILTGKITGNNDKFKLVSNDSNDTKIYSLDTYGVVVAKEKDAPVPAPEPAP